MVIDTSRLATRLDLMEKKTPLLREAKPPYRRPRPYAWAAVPGALAVGLGLGGIINQFGNSAGPIFLLGGLLMIFGSRIPAE